jgi:hypothetical protein
MSPTSSVSFFQVGFSSLSTLCFLLLPMLAAFFYFFPDTALPPHPFSVPPSFSCFFFLQVRFSSLSTFCFLPLPMLVVFFSFPP